MNTTVFEFPSTYSSDPKGIFDCFPDLKTIYWGLNMNDSIGEDVVPNREILLVMPEESGDYLMNIPEKVAVAIHINSISVSLDRPSSLIIFAWSENKNDLTSDAFDSSIPINVFQDLEYDPKGNWFAPIFRAHDGQTMTVNLKFKQIQSERKIESFSDFWKEEEIAVVQTVTQTEDDIEVILSQSDFDEILKRVEEKKKEDTRVFAIKIKSDFEKFSLDPPKGEGSLSLTYPANNSIILERLSKHLPALKVTLNEEKKIVARVAK